MSKVKVNCSNQLTDSALTNFDYLIGICQKWFPNYTEIIGHKLNEEPIQGICAFHNETNEGFSLCQFTVYEIDGISAIVDEKLGKTKLAFNSCFLKPYVREDERGIHLTSLPPKSSGYTCFLVTQVNVYQNTTGTKTDRILHIFLP